MYAVIGMLLLGWAVSANAFTLAATCDNGCGQEIIVAGSTATCSMIVGVDPGDVSPVTVVDGTATVGHTDGNEVIPVSGTPVDIAAGHSLSFPVIVTANASDLVGGSIPVQFDANFMAVGVSFPGSFGSRLAVVDSTDCTATTTTVTTITATTATTTTLPHRLGPPWGLRANGCGPMNPGCHKK